MKTETTEATEVEGWPNESTWGVALMIDQDQAVQRQCIDLAREARSTRHEEEDSGVWSHEEAEMFHAADTIKDRVEMLLDDIQLSGVRNTYDGECKTLLVRQLVSSALAQVKWSAIAEHFLSKLTEGV